MRGKTFLNPIIVSQKYLKLETQRNKSFFQEFFFLLTSELTECPLGIVENYPV